MAELFNQEDIIRCASLLSYTPFLQKFVPICKPEEFRQPELRWVTKSALEYYEKFKLAPSFDVFHSLLENDQRLKEEEKGIIVPFLHTMEEHRPKRNDRQYYAALFEKFIQHNYASRVTREIGDLISVGEIGKAEARLSEFRMPKSMELDLVFAPWDSDILFVQDKNFYVPTGIKALDDIIKGLAAGEEGVIMAPTGYGKSMFLVHLGAAAWRQGYNVLHFSFENSKEETMSRYLANMTGTAIDEIKLEGQTSTKLNTIKTEANEKGAAVAISRLIGRHTDVNKLLADINGVIDLYDFSPDLLVIDYGDLMIPTRFGKNKYEDMQTVFSELRDLAAETNLPLWTATQTNREGLKAKRVRLDHISESLGKIMTADLVVGLSRPEKDEEPEDMDISGDEAELRVLKLRRGAEAGRPAHVQTNFALARFDEVMSEEEKVDKLDQMIARKRNGE